MGGHAQSGTLVYVSVHRRGTSPTLARLGLLLAVIEPPIPVSAVGAPVEWSPERYGQSCGSHNTGSPSADTAITRSIPQQERL